MKTLGIFLKSSLILFFLFTSELFAQPVPQYQLSIQNRVLLGSTYQFDVVVKRIGSTNFRIGNSQFILTFDNGSFTSPSILRVSSSEQIGTGFFFDQVVVGNTVQISLGGNGSYESASDIDANTGTRISTYQITGANLPTPLVGLTWVNTPNLIRTGVSEINSFENYRDITDPTGNSHINTYAITANSDANGSISPAGVTIVNYNGSQTYTATPNLGYHLDSLFIDGIATSPSTSYTFNNVVNDHSIGVKFALNTINVTVNTNPPGLSVMIDGITYTSPHTMPWTAGTNHTIAADSIQAGTPGTQYVWQNWSDAGIRSHSINPLIDSTFTASFSTQYFLTMNAGAGGSVTPSSGWYNSGQSVGITGIPGMGYQFNSWIGSGTGSYTGINNPNSVTMNAPITQNASFGLIPIHVTLQTTPVSGLSFVVDGITYTSTQTFTWFYGSNHSIGTTTPQSLSPGTRYLWNNWSDGGAMTHTVAPISDSTFVVSFSTQYYLTTVASGSGTITPPSNWYNAGQFVQITATPNAGLLFGAWNGSGTGSYSGTNNPSSVVMNGPITETGTFVINAVHVTVQTNPTGLSAVVDGVSYICPQVFTWDYGTTHTIAASTPQPGVTGIRYPWSNWSDGGALSHTITPIGDSIVTATFSTQYNLVLAGDAGGTVSANPSSTDGWYNSGTVVHLTASPNAGSFFTAWRGSGLNSYTGTNNPAIVTMNSPVFDTAGFIINTYTISVTQSAHGTITPGTQTVNYGSTLSFSIIPDQGYHIDSVIVNGNYAGVISGYTFNNVRGDSTLRAVFAINRYSITITASNGSVSKNPNQLLYDTNTVVLLTPAPNHGYHFVGWSGDAGGSSVPLSIQMNANKNITALFGINSYTITANAGAHGVTTNPGVTTLTFGSNQSYTFTPDQYYQIDSVIIDGVYSGSSSSYAFNNIDTNHIIMVTFTAIPSYITTYRTFTYEELPILQPLKKKPATYYWEFNILNYTSHTFSQMNVTFKGSVLTILSSGNLSAVGSSIHWTFYGIIRPGDSIIIKGRSVKPSPQQIRQLSFGNGIFPPIYTPINPTVQRPELPMPNLANVRQEAYAGGAFSATRGLVVGVPKPDSAKYYGWVLLLKQKDMYKSLIDRSGLHTGPARGFQTFQNGRRFTNLQKSLPPLKQNNHLFAELLTLKFNIGLSQLGMTQPGFGELRFVDNNNPYTSMLVKDIAYKADSMMTFYLTNLSVYNTLDSTITKINRAFSGTFDTLSWWSTLKIKGVNNLMAVTYLQPTNIEPERITPSSAGWEDVPDRFELAQNYPNPFNPTTTIRYQLPFDSRVSLKIYDILGQVVATLKDATVEEAGYKSVQWNAANRASGIYFYRIEATSVRDPSKTVTQVRKMVVLK